MELKCIYVFELLIISLSSRLDLCYGDTVVEYSLPLFYILIGPALCTATCICYYCCCCCFFCWCGCGCIKNIFKTFQKRPSHSSISSVDRQPRRIPRLAFRSVDNTHSTNYSPQRTVINRDPNSPSHNIVRSSNSFISITSRTPRRRSISGSVDNTLRANPSLQRAKSLTQMDRHPPSVINTQLPIAPQYVNPTFSPSYEEATQYPQYI